MCVGVLGSVTLISLSWAFQLEQAMPISHVALEGANTNRAWGSGHPVVPAAEPRTLETGGADFLPGKSPQRLGSAGSWHRTPHLPWTSLLL